MKRAKLELKERGCTIIGDCNWQQKTQFSLLENYTIKTKYGVAMNIIIQVFNSTDDYTIFYNQIPAGI